MRHVPITTHMITSLTIQLSNRGGYEQGKSCEPAKYYCSIALACPESGRYCATLHNNAGIVSRL